MSIVVGVALLLRIFSLATLTLIITNDGTEYLHWAEILYRQKAYVVPSFRTPGYPVFLSLVFHAFGISSAGVLIAQHGLGVATCALITWTACRLAGPKWALIPGLACSLDPWLLGFESYALSETLAVFTTVLAATIALGWARPRLPAGFALGAALGVSCLVRPAGQALVPFFMLGWALSDGLRWRRMVIGLLAASAGFAVVVVPWLQYNRSRGVPGIASGFAMHQWMGMAHFGLLDSRFELEPAVENEFRKLAPKPDWSELHDFVRAIGAYGQGRRTALLQQWAQASVRANPGPYLQHCWFSLGWNLNYPCGPGTYDELNWYLERLVMNGNNIQFAGDPSIGGMNRFVTSSERGQIRRLLRWWLKHKIMGLPHIPLFALVLLTFLVAAIRKNWCVVLVFTGTIVSMLLHVVLLIPTARYTLCGWTLWYLSLAMFPVLLRRRPREADPASTSQVKATESRLDVAVTQ